ncbi:MAG: hypothetical protein QOJ03_477 [Frankiaceae bacterium]|nr:hypothetical protein [Frankiaceae bacterium]
MKYTRVVLGIVAATSVGAFALPSQAATSRTLFFDNAGTNDTAGCTPAYVLTKTAPAGSACESQTLGYGGNGEFASDAYRSVGSAAGFKIDASRKLTGTVYITNYPLVVATLGPVTSPDSTGGPAGADITIKINGVTVGKASGSGVAAPGSAYAVRVSMKIPAKLNGKVARSIEADVDMNAGVLLTGASYGEGRQSKLVVPFRR